MKLLYSFQCEPIPLHDDRLNTLVIENQRLFRRLVLDILNQQQGGRGEAVLSAENTILDFAKAAEVFLNPILITSNRKSLLTRLIARLEKNAMEPDTLETTQRLLANLESLLETLCEEYPIVFDRGKLTVGNLLKMAGMSIEERADGSADTILGYMDLISELEGEKLFLFVNLRSYLSDEETTAFAHEAALRHHRVLLLESVERSRVPNEERHIVDADLCEI